jgi:hypothetical protein
VLARMMMFPVFEKLSHSCILAGWSDIDNALLLVQEGSAVVEASPLGTRHRTLHDLQITLHSKQ